MSATSVGLGLLLELRYRDASGRDTRLHPPSRWLAWWPERRALLICKPASGTPQPLSAAVRRIHRAFHTAPMQRAVVTEWPDKRGPLQTLGRLVSLTYRVPSSVKSPEKKPYKWHHLFGDHGESGHGIGSNEKRYPDRLMPLLCRDLSGNLFIERQRGNRYYVSKWLMW